MTPASESELSQAILDADGPLHIVGGNTRGIARRGNRLSTAGFSGIRLYEPGALTLVAGAGTSVAEIDAALAEKGQRLSFEPIDHRTLLGTVGAPTIGGVVALNHAGPRRVQAGSVRDVLLGARFVDGRGRIVKNGGRVMKNVTGYDLARLQAGARGTLGVLTEVSLKVLPEPEQTITLARPGMTPDAAIADMSRALGSPYEVSGAALTGGTCHLRIEGFAASVRYRAERLQQLLPGYEAADTDWRAIRDVAVFADDPRDIWRLSMQPSHSARLTVDLARAGCDVQLDWGGGLVWVAAAPDTDIPEFLKGLSGHATRIRGQKPLPTCPPSPAIAALQQGLRDKFDPRGLFRS
ncbi:MAG: FAD-binding protein [Maritimibacter sp.]|nr:FAD-binding protein [Maritimibacter sp.]